MKDTVKVVSIMEAQSVTGPAKNLLEFARRARQAPQGLPAVDLSVVTYHRGSLPPESNPFIAEAKASGIAVDVIQESGALDRSAIPQISAALANRKPDLVQTHNSKSHFLMRYTGLCKQYRWLPFHHGYTRPDLKMWMIHQLDRWSLRAPSHIVTVCGPFRDQLAGHGIPTDRVTVQHNAIKPFVPASDTAVEKIRRDFHLPTGTPLLVMISRLSHEKGHVDFVRAAAILKQRGVPFHAVIVGEGLERTPIEAERAKHQLGDSITLVGHQNIIAPYLTMASLFLMPSHSEGSPNALLEAMAAGVPVVAAHVGGIPEIATHDENAYLVPPSNPVKLAEAIETLLRDQNLRHRLSSAARLVTERFTYEAYHRALLGIYQRVLAEKPAA
ncbi:glycosyl transferase (plasmid) [Bryobacterales bacterium F-183]|nr:glycosyl transferase [Bryobacterales bacterium F-183]